MPIKSLEFEDYERPWKLKSADFDGFNLLVGLSGVGKTHTLHVVNQLGRAARGSSHDLVNCAWTMAVETSEGVFTWEAQTEPDGVLASADDDDDDSPTAPLHGRVRSRFVSEVVTGDAGVVAQRSQHGLSLKGQAVPRLRAEDSITSLFEEEPMLSVRRALGAIHFSRARADLVKIFDNRKLERILREVASIDQLRSYPKTDLLSKAYVLKRRFPEEFNRVQNQLIDIFDTIEEVDMGPLSQFRSLQDGQPFDFLVPAFRERGIKGWIDGFEMSNGMRRTLLHLLELHLEPPGSVLLIDEYENGMGVNCLPQVTEMILERCCDLQLIFTSHHPYVINNVSKQHWRIMRRNGHEVEILRPRDIERLNTASNMDAFVQLLNAPEFEQGLQ